MEKVQLRRWRRMWGLSAVMAVMMLSFVEVISADAESPLTTDLSFDEGATTETAKMNDASNKPFFWFNEISGESVWELPVVERIDDETGKVFFYDTEVNEASWVRPSSSMRMETCGNIYIYRNARGAVYCVFVCFGADVRVLCMCSCLCA